MGALALREEQLRGDGVRTHGCKCAAPTRRSQPHLATFVGDGDYSASTDTMPSTARSAAHTDSGTGCAVASTIIAEAPLGA